jgi:hypothetical protein
LAVVTAATVMILRRLIPVSICDFVWCFIWFSLAAAAPGLIGCVSARLSI